MRYRKNVIDYICVIKEKKTIYKKHYIYRGYKYPHQIEKTIWYGKLSDPDFHTPSCPHLHNSIGNKKLNVYTGEFYDVQNKKYTGKFVGNKVLEDLWKDKKFVSFVNKARTRAKELFPTIDLPSIPTFEKGTKNNNKISLIYYHIAKLIHKKRG